MRAKAIGMAAAAAVCAVAAGCAAGGTEPGSGDGTSVETGAPAPSTAPPPTAAGACIVGAWEAGAAQLQPVYDAIPSGLDYPAATLGRTSSVVVTFADDGRFTLEQRVPVTLEWLGHPAAVVLGGRMSGEYRATDGDLELAAADNRLTVQPRDDRAASELFAAATAETLVEWPVSASAFACEGDALTLELETEGHPAAVEFARR
ncbi:MAG: hypothetical protein QM611_12010 [Microbacterium sp.]|uniref:hypothetical protein n=1 Tax=Microbacterium sp. TaxID=51671 RepID=UPI0039E26F6F